MAARVTRDGLDTARRWCKGKRLSTDRNTRVRPDPRERQGIQGSKRSQKGCPP